MKRLLVVGGGLIGSRHVATVQAHPDCELAGLVDPDPSIPADPDVPRFYRIQDVTGPIDGAIIATPTHLHAEHGMYAARQGWPVLIEKPVAGDLEGALALQEALRTAGVASLVGHHRRYHAAVQQLKEVITQGKIGRIVAANLIWAMRKPNNYFEGNWRAAGGSPVLINLVHDIDLLRFVIGEINCTTALPASGLRGADRIESGAVALAFSNGAVGTICFSDTSPSPWGFEAGTGENPNIGETGQDMMWIMGTKGAVSFPSLTLWVGQDWAIAAKKQPMPVAQNARTPLQAQLDHFLGVIDGALPLVDVADATQTVRIALEIEAQLTDQRKAQCG